MGYSTTYAATILMFLSLLAGVFHFQLPDSINEVTIGGTISLIVGIASAFHILRERYKKGGVTPLGFRTVAPIAPQV